VKGLFKVLHMAYLNVYKDYQNRSLISESKHVILIFTDN
jgi:hypothetical protein